MYTEIDGTVPYEAAPDGRAGRSWQFRGHQPDETLLTNENTNGLLRQYFPKGTDLSRWSLDDILAVQDAINSRPRKVLGWKTPAEALNEQLLSLHQAGVASTG